MLKKGKTMLLLFSCILLIVLCTKEWQIQAAPITTLVHDDFEQYSPNEAIPTSSADYWRAVSPTSTLNVVAREDSETNNIYASISNTHATQGVYFGKPFAAAQSTLFVSEFDLNIPSSSSTGRLFYYNSANLSGGNLTFRMDLGGGSMRVHDGTTQTTVVSGYSTSTWYHFKIVFDPENKRFSFTITDGSETIYTSPSFFSFANVNATTVGSLSFMPGFNGVEMNVDNVNVYVPNYELEVSGPLTLNVQSAQTAQFTAIANDILGRPVSNPDVVWSLYDASNQNLLDASSGITISHDGLLNVQGSSLPISVNVRATNAADPTVYASQLLKIDSAYLSGLSATNMTFSESFEMDKFQYSSIVGTSVAATQITATSSFPAHTDITVNDEATASGVLSSPVGLVPGINEVTVKVASKAFPEISSTYTLLVSQTDILSDDATLSELTLSNGALAFSSETTSYTTSVANTVASVTVALKTSNVFANATVNDVAMSGPTSAPIPLQVGDNLIAIHVTAQDGTTNDYTITVNRAKSDNANLSNLTLSGGVLNPTFASSTTEYTANAANGAASLTVTPTTENEAATITVQGDTVDSGQSTAPISLEPGSNVIEVIVTAQDGTTTKTYTIDVNNREPVTSYLFDFGPGELETGYIGVSCTASSLYNADIGYGWASVNGLDGRDRGAPTDALRRDFCVGNAYSFTVDLPNGLYKVKVIAGDATAGLSGMNIVTEGQTESLSAASGTFASKTLFVELLDGQMNMAISGSSARINALEISAASPEDIWGSTALAVTDNGDGTVTLQNSKVSLVIAKTTANITNIRFNGSKPTLNLGTGGYLANYKINGVSGQKAMNGATFSIVSQSDERIELSFLVDNPNQLPYQLDVRMVLEADSPGLYYYSIYKYTSDMPAGLNLEQLRYSFSPPDSIFKDYAIDDLRKGVYDTALDLANGPELQDATHLLADGTAYTKYQQITSLEGDSHVFGVYGDKIGMSIIQASKEYFVGGPTKQELTTHQTDRGPRLLWHEITAHYGNTNLTPPVGWEKVYGPFYLYLNEGDSTDAMWNDAKERAEEERSKWPYTWVTDPLYAANSRGNATGTLTISDGSSANNAWVILAAGDKDWQLQNEDYVYYVRAASDGSFSIPAVRPGEYTLYAFVDGVFDEFRKDHVVIQSNETTDLGVLSWVPKSNGELLWQIGTPDRSAAEFYVTPNAYASTIPNLDKFRQFGTWLEYPLEFPNGVDFKVGVDDPSEKWNFFQPVSKTPGDPAMLKVARDSSPAIWKIRFDSDGYQSGSGTGTMTFGLAGSVYGSLLVKLNGVEIGRWESPGNGKSAFGEGPENDASLYRQGAARGIYHQVQAQFDAGLIHQGENIVELSLPTTAGNSSWNNAFTSIMYDAIRLEVDVATDEPQLSGPGAGHTNGLEGKKIVDKELLKSTNDKVSILLSEKEIELLLPAEAIELLGSKPIVVTKGSISVEIPSSVLKTLKSMIPVGEISDAQLVLKIDRIGEEASNALVKAAADKSSAGIKAVSDVYDFRLVAVTKDGKEVKLERFETPITLTFKVDANTDTRLAGVYFVDDQGRLEYVGGTLANGEIRAGIYHFSKYAVLEFNKTFADIAATHWAAETVKELAARHIINGVSDKLFAPEQRVTRAEFTAMLVRALKMDASHEASPFQDVAADAWYAEPIGAAYNAGLIKGRDNVTFEPNAWIKREEMAVMIVRAYEWRSGKQADISVSLSARFKDAEQISHWAEAGVRAAVSHKLLQGRSQQEFIPQGIASRAESAQVIFNLLKNMD